MEEKQKQSTNKKQTSDRVTAPSYFPLKQGLVVELEMLSCVEEKQKQRTNKKQTSDKVTALSYSPLERG